MIHLGTVRPGSTLRIPFDSFALSTGAPSALSNFAVGDILVYKDSSTTERASTTGYTATTTFDSLTGHNEAIIDLSSDATADFFKSGSSYKVVISPVTIDGQTMSFTIATFDIGYPNALLNTSIATLASQTSFTLTSGPAEDNALNGMWCLVHSKASKVQISWAIVTAYTGASKTVTLAATPALTFTAAAIDNISFFAPSPLQPSVMGSKEVVQTGDGYAIVNSGTFGNSALKTLLDTIAGYVDTEVAAILAAVDTEVAAIKAKTDSLTFTVANVLDANTLRVGGTVQTAGDLAAMITAVDDYVDTEVAAIKAKTDNLPSAIKKNIALAKFMFQMKDSADHVTPKTGLTVACQRSIDGAAFANCNTATATEISAGWYYVDLAASDLNGNVIAFKGTSAGADQRDLLIVTQT